MDIQQRINKIKAYFQNMNVADGIIYLEVLFPQKWVISQNINEKFGIKIAKKEDSGYYFFDNLENGFEPLFNAIDYTITFNEQAEEKIKLLLTKIEELKNIFDNESIDVLKTIEFKYKKKIKRKTKEITRSQDEEKTEDSNEPTTVEINNKQEISGNNTENETIQPNE